MAGWMEVCSLGPCLRGVVPALSCRTVTSDRVQPQQTPGGELPGQAVMGCGPLITPSCILGARISDVLHHRRRQRTVLNTMGCNNTTFTQRFPSPGIVQLVQV